MEEATTDNNSQNKFLPGKSVDASDCDDECSKECNYLKFYFLIFIIFGLTLC